MNKIVLMGRMVKEPEVRYTQNGKVVAQFTLAVDRPFSSQDGKREADFIPCVLWGKTAETFGNTVHKGQRVLVEGRIQIRNYEAKDGSRRYITEAVVNTFEYVERKTEAPSQEEPKAFDGVPVNEDIPF